MNSAKVWKSIVAVVGERLDEELLDRGELATDHALELHVRDLAGEDTLELQLAVAASFANLRGQGADELVNAIRVAIRSTIEQALLVTFEAIHPIAGVVARSIGAALEPLDSDPDPIR